MSALNLYECTFMELNTLKGVGEKTANDLIAMRKNAIANKVDLTIEDLSAINNKVEWQQMLDDGQICLKTMGLLRQK